MFHILVHHGPNTGDLGLKSAVYIVYDIGTRIDDGGNVKLSYLIEIHSEIGGNVKPSYLIEIHSAIGTLFHILVHQGPNTGEIVLKVAVSIVDNIGKRMEWDRTLLSRLLLALVRSWNQTQ